MRSWSLMVVPVCVPEAVLPAVLSVLERPPSLRVTALRPPVDPLCVPVLRDDRALAIPWPAAARPQSAERCEQ